MKYIIMADGQGKRWNNYMGVPKHLIELNGERLIDRTVRLLKENDIQNIIVMASDERYKIEGTKLIPQSIREYEVDRFDLQFLNGEVCYLYGDVYYTEEAIQKIVETPTDDILVFGRNKPSEINKKEYGELFAFKVKNADKFKQCVSYIRNEVIAGRNRGLGWELYSHIGCPFILIDDRSEDFDYPKDFDRWLEYEHSNLLS